MFQWLVKGENCSLIANTQVFLLVFNYGPYPPYGKHATKRLTPLGYVDGLSNIETFLNSTLFVNLTFHNFP